MRKKGSHEKAIIEPSIMRPIRRPVTERMLPIPPKDFLETSPARGGYERNRDRRFLYYPPPHKSRSGVPEVR